LAQQQEGESSFAANRWLRTKNTALNHLGLPLPSGSVAVYRGQGDGRRLESESTLRDLAVGQALEIKMGTSADVQVEWLEEDRTATRLKISNARRAPIRFELRLKQDSRVVQANHPLSSKDGRPILYVLVPAQGTTTIRFVCAVPRT
jgi:hypothetical protein